MGYDHNRSTKRVDPLQKLHDLRCILMVQVSSRLIGKKHLRPVDEGAGNSHTLLFSAGKLMRERLILGRKSHQLQHARNLFADFSGGSTYHTLGKCYIFKYRPVF